MQKITHLMYVPFTGLGNYGGYRGSRWLKNRIKVFKQFVIPSLLAQSNKDFIVWVSWRNEERNNKQVKELKQYLDNIGLRNVFTYAGVCFYDDKYDDNTAKERVLMSIHHSMGDLINVIGDSEYVYLTIQPSDDCYRSDFVENIRLGFQENDVEALGFTRGYIMNYKTKEIKEWNPSTNPPFYTIKFKKEIFVDPLKHFDYTSIKKDVGKYKKGTPIPSHEYVGDALNYIRSDERGFLVGVHGENISTVFDHPFAGETVNQSVLESFGLDKVEPLVLRFSVRKRLLRMLPYKWQRKLRYLFGERFYNKIYEFLRN